MWGVCRFNFSWREAVSDGKFVLPVGDGFAPTTGENDGRFNKPALSCTMTTSAPHTLNDIVLEPTADGGFAVFVAKGYPKKKVAYLIDGEEVRRAVTFPFHDFVLLRTDAGAHPRTADNKPLIDDARWADHYFEPHTNSLYRRDERANWYDLEGFRLTVPVFRKDDVLISLPGKTSKRSWAFTDAEVLISPHGKLIQVGKLLYDEALTRVQYFGEKLTGLGPKHISFGGTDQWQEVRRGMTDRAFINEFTAAPLLINDEEIVEHLRSESRGNRHFEVFRSATREYTLENHSGGDMRFKGAALTVDLDSYLRLNEAEIVKVNDGRRDFYLDLDTRAPFRVPEVGEELLTKVDPVPVQLPGAALYSMTTAHRAFVYDATKREVFQLPGMAEPPTAVRIVPGYEAYWFMALVDGRWRLCDEHGQSVIRLGKDELEVSEVRGTPGDKLLNAIAVTGEPIVLDVRRGADHVELGIVDGARIHRTTSEPKRVGGRALQHVELASLGGSVPRVIDLELNELTTFTLPKDLTVYPDQKEISSFAGNAITRIDFAAPLTVQGETFFPATFLTFVGEERRVLLQSGNVRPLHLDGVAHRNELVVDFNPETRTKGYRLGEHMMVSVKTLNEELKEGEFLYSLLRNQSWLPFYDSFLPVFRRAVPLKGEVYWPCLLFESLEHNGAGEYIAVEKNKPYRVLAENRRGKIVPKVVTTKSRALQEPDEVSGLVKMFVDMGMLVEVN